MDPCMVSRLVERAAVGEGGEGVYIAQSGRRIDLLVIRGGKATIGGDKGKFLRTGHVKRRAWLLVSTIMTA